MRTLRNEATRLGYHYKAGYNTFMDEYGSYRVVEGVLKLADGQAWIETRGAGLYPCLGVDGDNVKLILPPEEKDVTDVTADMLRVSRAQTDASRAREASERARADRYEKGLREIAADRWADRVVRRIAREALDE